MNNEIHTGSVICGKCRLEIERTSSNKHCSNCFACTGCEIYYCPRCNNEIIVTPVKPVSHDKKEKAGS
ncbi:MAG: hypothetical protein U0X39_07880 [Bacteroidales bacterium]